MRNHRLSEKDFEKRTAVCSICGPVELLILGNAWMCANSYRDSRAWSKARLHEQWWPPKADRCEVCTFVPVDPCQLVQDVVTGKYATKNNIWTLCANCQRLLHYRRDLFEERGRQQVDRIEIGERREQVLAGRKIGKHELSITRRSCGLDAACA